ncbi:hypothetical protein [Actinomadura monticuli]|uniref:Uncharacterized protein n=1 Tax=Actinomadura monticuli TaxID=3097367 RepID=A0ABV4QBB0_9ACTN
MDESPGWAAAGLGAELPAEQGRADPIASLPGLTVEIVPTAIRDRYGEKTGEVVG